MAFGSEMARRAAGFPRRDGGGASTLGMFVVVATMAFGGFAIDLAQINAARTQLQIATDTAAHAALVTRHRGTEEEARAAALEIATRNMPPNRFGAVITDDDIEFGVWNRETQAFEAQPGARMAVRVRGSRQSARENQVHTYLLRMLGLRHFDLVEATVLARHVPPCLREGFVAEGRVRVRSNNYFGEGFCIHSNDYVELNQNNIFMPGTVVSMPDFARLGIPASGFEKNEGLAAALRQGVLDIRILREMEHIVAALQDGDREYVPDYITDTLGVDIDISNNNRSLTMAQLSPGSIHRLHCQGNNGRVDLPGDTVIEDIVIVTNCDIQIGQSARLENVVLVTTSTSDRSISGASDSIFGRDDNCGGGGAKILTMGGMRFAARLTLHGSQLIAQGDIQFAAQGAGIRGASLVAGGEIDGTSNMNMGICGEGMEDGFQAGYFRMVF